MKWAVFMHKRRLFVVAVVAMLIVAVSGISFADLRIVTDGDGDTQELFVKGGRIRTEIGDEQWMLIDCASAELTLVGNGRYWQGRQTDFANAVAQQLVGDEGDAVEMMGLLGQLFGGGGTEPLSVRVTKVGTDAIAGYEATQYRVETGAGNRWETYENVWLSAPLMQLLNNEAGQCFRLMLDYQEQMMAALPFLPADMKAVLENEEYRRLHIEAYPVRTVTNVEFFGMSFETVSEVVEISRDPLPDSLFQVPAGFRRIDNTFDILIES